MTIPAIVAAPKRARTGWVYNRCVDRHQHPLRLNGSSRGRLFAGLVLCALVVVFSLAAKVSWYQQSTSPTHSISKMKAFKAEPQAHATTQAAAIPLPLAAIPVVIALAALFLFEAGCSTPKEKRSRKSSRGFGATTAARPPPSR